VSRINRLDVVCNEDPPRRSLSCGNERRLAAAASVAAAHPSAAGNAKVNATSNRAGIPMIFDSIVISFGNAGLAAFTERSASHPRLDASATRHGAIDAAPAISATTGTVHHPPAHVAAATTTVTPAISISARDFIGAAAA
jgi:hypothetical protein